MDQNASCYFRRQRDGWTPVPKEVHDWLVTWERNAMEADRGPGRALWFSHSNVKIDNLVITYLVRVTWEHSIHYREIHFPSGEECQVHFSASGEEPGFPGNWRSAH